MDKTDQQNVMDGSALEINRKEKTVEAVARLTSMALSIVSLVTMIKNSTTNEYGSLSYSNLGAFNHYLYCKLRVWTLFVFDQVVTYVVLAAASVSAETVYLTYKGNIDITWSSACDYYGNFCHKALFSVLFTFVVSILYVLLSFISSYRVFTRFEAPKM
ncbi:unnamed protein product [Cochlearia groenlandica]